MNIKFNEEGTYISYDKALNYNIDFDLAHTFLCGQCFRWNALQNGNFIGVAMGKVLELEQKEDGIVLLGVDRNQYENIWSNYFDMSRDYTAIKSFLATDPVLADAITHGYGIRILRQNIFEALISFIISQNNHIPRIKKAIDGFSQTFGQTIHHDRTDSTYYAFPSVERLKGIKVDDLSHLKLGYRDSYIVDAIEKIISGEINLELIVNMDYTFARKEIMKIKGVGPKVADCILLFGGGYVSSFPIDVWVRRVMSNFYFGNVEVDIKAIETFAREKFGDYGGFAQQYLFYFARENKVK